MDNLEILEHLPKWVQGSGFFTLLALILGYSFKFYDLNKKTQQENAKLQMQRAAQDSEIAHKDKDMVEESYKEIIVNLREENARLKADQQRSMDREEEYRKTIRLLENGRS